MLKFGFKNHSSQNTLNLHRIYSIRKALFNTVKTSIFISDLPLTFSFDDLYNMNLDITTCNNDIVFSQ